MTTTNSFLGIPVEGDIVRRDPKKKQRPLEVLSPLLQAVLDDPTIVELGWTQYTPHFNDGDPCEFGAGEPWFRTTENAGPSPDGDEEDEETWQLELRSNTSLGTRDRTWNHETRTYDQADYAGPDEARYDRCAALSAAIEGGEFDEVLLEAFGDHAQITVKKDGIQVEFYDHD